MSLEDILLLTLKGSVAMCTSALYTGFSRCLVGNCSVCQGQRGLFRVAPVWVQCAMQAGFLGPHSLLTFFVLILVKHAQHKPFQLNHCLASQLRDVKNLYISTMAFQGISFATNNIASIKYCLQFSPPPAATFLVSGSLTTPGITYISIFPSQSTCPS